MAPEIVEDAKQVPARVGGGIKGIIERIRRMPKIQLMALGIAVATLIVGYLAWRSRSGSSAIDPLAPGMSTPMPGGADTGSGGVTPPPAPPHFVPPPSPYVAPPSLNGGGGSSNAVYSTYQAIVGHHTNIAPVGSLGKTGEVGSVGKTSQSGSTGGAASFLLNAARNAMAGVGSVGKHKEPPPAVGHQGKQKQAPPPKPGSAPQQSGIHQGGSRSL